MASATTKTHLKKYRGYVFIAPAIILLILVAVFPLINTFTISFRLNSRASAFHRIRQLQKTISRRMAFKCG